MKRWWTEFGTAVAMVVVAAMATESALAQGGRGGPGGGPMRGAFGAGRGGLASLLMMPEVQKELSITDEQKAEIAKLAGSLMRGGPPGGPGGGPPTNDDERQKLMADQATRMQKMLDNVQQILKPEQFARLEQLRNQREGAMSFNRPDVAEKLGLSEEQKTKIRELASSLAGPGGPGGPGGGQSFFNMTDEQRQKAFADLQESRKKTESELIGLLSQPQKTAWEEMQGAKFEFPATPWGAGRGGRGGPPGGPGGAPPGDRPRRPPTE